MKRILLRQSRGHLIMVPILVPVTNMMMNLLMMTTMTILSCFLLHLSGIVEVINILDIFFELGISRETRFSCDVTHGVFCQWRLMCLLLG